MIKQLILSGEEMSSFYRNLPPLKLNYQYASGKWTPLQILGHIIDSERVFSYRALTFVREEDANIPGFEQDDYILGMNIDNRRFISLINELANLRASTIDLFSSFSTEQRRKLGKASGVTLSVEDLGRMIIGHEKWHRKILKERYL